MLGLSRFRSEELGEAYRRFFLAIRNYVIFVLILVAIAYFVGVPHLQTTYKYIGPTPANGIPRTEQKVEAWYVGPSRDGFHLVRAGQYGNRGCPYILFIPFEDCYSLPWTGDE